MVYKFPSSRLNEAFEFYKKEVSELNYTKEKPVPKTEFKKIHKLFGSLLIDYVLKGREVGLPNGIGTIIAVKHEKKRRFSHVNAYDQAGKCISDNETVMLDRFGYSIKFRRNGATCQRAVTGFRFLPSWAFRNKLKLLVRAGFGGRYSYLTSKTLYRNEI